MACGVIDSCNGSFGCSGGYGYECRLFQLQINHRQIVDRVKRIGCG